MAKKIIWHRAENGFIASAYGLFAEVRKHPDGGYKYVVSVDAPEGFGNVVVRGHKLRLRDAKALAAAAAGRHAMYRCTKDFPWKPGIPGPVEHEGAHEVGERRDGYPGGDIQEMECRDCGHRWTVELPQ